jgi:hypothetical protein
MYKNTCLKTNLWCIVFLIFAGCKQSANLHNEIVLTFLGKVKNDDHESAELMLWQTRNVNMEFNNRELKILNDLLTRYRVPDSKEWIIEYDTVYLVKLKKITIPLFKGYDPTNKLKEANVTIEFEFKGEHIGNKIFDFRTFTMYDDLPDGFKFYIKPIK